jgi:hypothetical protein
MLLGHLPNESLLEYRVTELEMQLARHREERHGRPVMIATIVIGCAGVVQAIAAVLLLTGRLG